MAHVMWWDNFSKILSRSVPSIHSGIFSQCLWTCMAAFRYRGDVRVSIDVVRSDNEIVPAMPADILMYKNNVKQGITWVMTNSRRLYDDSLVRSYDINNIPPKVNVNVHTQLRQVLNDDHNSTRSVHPVKLLPYNIGSNAGLLHILQCLCEDNGIHTDECRQYKLINADENIYWRILKV